MGVQRVVIVGPSPEWTEDLPKILQRFVAQDQAVPQRLVPAVLHRSLDERLEDVTKRLGVHYFSPARYLCAGGTCVVSDSPREVYPIQYDKDHLTTRGSVLVVQRLSALLSGAIRPAT